MSATSGFFVTTSASLRRTRRHGALPDDDLLGHLARRERPQDVLAAGRTRHEKFTACPAGRSARRVFAVSTQRDLVIGGIATRFGATVGGL